MKDNQAKYPQLRFNGFTDPWEERKLGELSNIVGGGTPSTSNSEYWDGDIDWYAPAEIGEQRYVSKSKKTITELGLKKSSARILPVGTVLFTSRAGIGNTAILGKEAATNQGFQSIVPNPNKLDSYFIYSRTNELKRYGEVTGAGSTFVEVSGKQMSKMSIMVPELSEQKKIGSFFEQLDNTIALHQRKLAKLKELKQGYLQKLFPENGSKFPQLRFAGFADAWEERKFFESIASTIDFRGRTPKKLGMDWSESGYLALSALNVKNGYIDPLADAHYGDENLYKKWMSGKELKKGQVLFTTEAPMGNVAQVPDNNGYILSQRTVAFETKEDMMTNDFLAVLLKSPLVFNNLSALSSGGTAKGVSQKSLKGLSITVPFNIDEQQKIGSFFKQLDDTIALHQRKLEKLQELKKGYLQKMFC
ncbi:restriction endonuclease subunit S [Lactiplantibacillus paraxiangfangensis]|uniref:restriction endonuclease subunit S n=1 Tax=Lactiplantibacillus paraxiangfangensis TaxID=3076224 RepID=UPI0030C76418